MIFRQSKRAGIRWFRDSVSWQQVECLFLRGGDNSRRTAARDAHHTVRAQAHSDLIVGPVTPSPILQAKMANLGWLWSFVWLIILLALAWPLGIVAAVFYAIFSPFAACCAGCSELSNFLMRGVKLPYEAASNMVHGRSGCWRLTQQDYLVCKALTMIWSPHHVFLKTFLSAALFSRDPSRNICIWLHARRTLLVSTDIKQVGLPGKRHIPPPVRSTRERWRRSQSEISNGNRSGEWHPLNCRYICTVVWPQQIFPNVVGHLIGDAQNFTKQSCTVRVSWDRQDRKTKTNFVCDEMRQVICTILFDYEVKSRDWKKYTQEKYASSWCSWPFWKRGRGSDVEVGHGLSIHPHPQPQGGGGGTHYIFGWRCVTQSWKPSPCFRQKYTIFCTLFQTGLSKYTPYFRPDSQNIHPISDPVTCGNFGNSQ